MSEQAEATAEALKRFEDMFSKERADLMRRVAFDVERGFADLMRRAAVMIEEIVDPVGTAAKKAAEAEEHAKARAEYQAREERRRKRERGVAKLCGCGCEHFYKKGVEVRHAGKEGCRCSHYVHPKKWERFKKLHAEALAKQETPEEQAKIEQERARLAEAAKRSVPLKEYLTRFGDAPKKAKRKKRSKA